MTPQQWLDRLAQALPGEPPALDREEREVLLDLARVAAHTSERWAAPLSTYLAGVALAGTAAPERVQRLRRIVTELEVGPDAGGEAGA